MSCYREKFSARTTPRREATYAELGSSSSSQWQLCGTFLLMQALRVRGLRSVVL